MKNLFVVCCLIVCSTITHAQEVSVSGLSSGGYFAHQFHVAYSSQVSGAGVLAGGPYFCARGNINDALNRCMDTAAGAPRAEEALREATRREREGKIDPLKNLARSKVYLLSGTADRTVLPVLGQRLMELYLQLGVTREAIMVEDRLPVGHAFPTEDFGNRCDDPSRSPYISNCGRDVAGEILATLVGPLRAKVLAEADRLFSFEQARGLDPAGISLARLGFAYVPRDCENQLERCHLHVAFHGCRQTTEDIGMDYVQHTGYNGWAESNRIVILYPQAVRNMMLGNPRGCWDWWGYTGALYHTKEGPQMLIIARVIEDWRKGKLKLKPWSARP